MIIWERRQRCIVVCKIVHQHATMLENTLMKWNLCTLRKPHTITPSANSIRTHFHFYNIVIEAPSNEQRDGKKYNVFLCRVLVSCAVYRIQLPVDSSAILTVFGVYAFSDFNGTGNVLKFILLWIVITCCCCCTYAFSSFLWIQENTCEKIERSSDDFSHISAYTYNYAIKIRAKIMQEPDNKLAIRSSALPIGYKKTYAPNTFNRIAIAK